MTNKYAEKYVRVLHVETSVLNTRTPLCFVVAANFQHYKKREDYLPSFCRKFRKVCKKNAKIF